MSVGKEAGPSLDEALTPSIRTGRGRLAASAFVALIILAALALVLVWLQYRDAQEKARSELRARAELAATVFDTYFAGQLQALSAIAASPTVVAGEPADMARYFARFRPGSGSTFTAGVGWIDLVGRQRATSDPRGPVPLSLADRTYFRAVLSSKKPFVSEAIVARTTERRLVVMSVPTRDKGGRLTGVLAGGIVLEQSGNDPRASDLGYTGLEVIDRTGQQITRRDLARPRNAELAAQLRSDREGMLADTRGLDGSGGRVVAFAWSEVPEWTTVLDVSSASLYADARRALALEAALVAGAVLMVFGLIVWALRRARGDLRAGRARINRWARLTRSLNEAVDAGAICDILGSALVLEFPEASIVVTLDDAGTGKARQAAVIHGARSPLRGIDGDVALSVADAIAGGGVSVALETQADVRRRTALDGAPGRSARSLYGAPLLNEQRLDVGAAALLFDVEHALGTHELTLVQAHADQAALALARVRRHEQEHDVAVLLQESLLPDDIPLIAGLQVAARYRAGVLNTSVGGDWYDVVRRPDGIVHLTVGDVAGRGIDAAVSMAQLRNAFRAYALDQLSPASVVQRLGRHVGEDGMATMVCVACDPYTQELAYATAGHLPPLLVDPAAATVTRLQGASGVPLGWTPNTPEEQRVIAPTGAILALYTDGLVERRGSDLDDCIDRLGVAVLDAAPAELADSADVVVRQLSADSRSDDDLALLLVRLQGAPSALRVELSAEPLLVRELRRRVRIWLSNRGVDEGVREAAVVALTEACNNAIEHAYRGESGTIRVHLEHHPDVLKIRVADDGTWREPTADSTRGRGLRIMTGLMDGTEIVQGSQGTEVLLEQRLSSPTA